MKKIEIVESWTKTKQPFSSIVISGKMGGKPVEWVMQKKTFVGPEWYQVFSNIKGMKFNWIIKIWCKLNNL